MSTVSYVAGPNSLILFSNKQTYRREDVHIVPTSGEALKGRRTPSQPLGVPLLAAASEPQGHERAAREYGWG